MAVQNLRSCRFAKAVHSMQSEQVSWVRVASHLAPHETKFQVGCKFTQQLFVTLSSECGITKNSNLVATTALLSHKINDVSKQPTNWCAKDMNDFH
jgi:hypothetical protein